MAMKLTGETRYRTERNWRGKEFLVLQVQEAGLRTYYTGGHVDTDHFIGWRDARVEDLGRVMAHKCSNGASDTTDNDLQRPDPAR